MSNLVNYILITPCVALMVLGFLYTRGQARAVAFVERTMPPPQDVSDDPDRLRTRRLVMGSIIAWTGWLAAAGIVALDVMLS